MKTRLFRSRLDKADEKLSQIYDGRHLQGFRDDAEEIWMVNRKDKNTTGDSKKVATDVQASAEHLRNHITTIENGVNKLQIIDGLTGGFLAIILYWLLQGLGVSSFPSVLASVTLFTIFTLLNHGILYTKAILDRLCYQKASPREDYTKLLFKRAWNTGVLSSNTSIIGILVISLTRSYIPRYYERGMDYVKSYDKRRLSQREGKG